MVRRNNSFLSSKRGSVMGNSEPSLMHRSKATTARDKWPRSSTHLP